MLFNSYLFVLVFLPVVLCGYFLLRHSGRDTAAKLWLVAASLVFYGYAVPWYLILIVSSFLVNYFCGHLIRRSTPLRRKWILAAALLLDLGCLFYYKYYDFFISNVNALLGTDLRVLKLTLPLGISFYTFQQISYVIDCFRGDAPDYSFTDYALFVTFFPQLVAGPIVLHSEITPQFNDPEKKLFCPSSFAAGVFGFSLGMAKKVLLADVFGTCADYAFGHISSLGTFGAAAGMLAYTFQIYFDFSGYSDMAAGIGKMMNIDIPRNFNSPYKALDIVDFWKRWHITLTRFFTAYVYIPLGGSRRGTARTCLNVLIVFLLSGIWHGANWTFILWGILHGIANVITRLANERAGSPAKKHKAVRILLWCVTFLFINLTWVLFRADSVGQAAAYLRQLFSFRFAMPASEMIDAFRTGIAGALRILPGIGNMLYRAAPVLYFLFALGAVLYKRDVRTQTDTFRPTRSRAVLSALLLTLCVLSFAGVSSFLYWNF